MDEFEGAATLNVYHLLWAEGENKVCEYRSTTIALKFNNVLLGEK